MEKEPHMQHPAAEEAGCDRNPDHPTFKHKATSWLRFLAFSAVLLVVFFCGLLFVGSQPQQETDVTRAIEVKPGQMFFNDDHYHLSSQGGQLVEYPLDIPLSQWRQLPHLVIEATLNNENVWAQVLWKNGDDVVASSQIKNSQLAVVSLPAVVKEWDEEALSAYIQFGPLLDLGAASGNNDFVYQRMRLTSDSVITRWQMLWSHWQTFTPLRASALNYWSIQDITMPTALWLMGLLTVWLLGCWFMGVSLNQLTIAILLLWLVFSGPWLVNQVNNRAFINQRFDELAEGINDEDQSILQFSEQLRAELQSQNADHLPLMLALRGDFHRTRMAYHLHDLPVFMMTSDMDLDVLKRQKAVTEMLILTSEAVLSDCDLSHSIFPEWQSGELILQMDGYCVVKR